MPGRSGRTWAVATSSRQVPAGRYSPSMKLHPMFRPEVSAKDAAFPHSWNA